MLSCHRLANRVFALLSVLLLVLLPHPPAAAAVMGVTVSPKQGELNVTEGGAINLKWVVSTSPAHAGGAYSAQGLLTDPVSGATLHTVATPFNRTDGSGPLHFDEVLTLTPAQLQEWQAKGISALAYQRSFGSATADASKQSAVASANLIITLAGTTDTAKPRAPAAGLFIHKLNLRFTNARYKRRFMPGSSVRAKLDLRYSGTGLMQGSWQIASVVGDGSKPIFTTLAQVRKQLKLVQREFLVSPELPMQTPGSYRLRFCVEPLVMAPEQMPLDGQCPEPELMAEIDYRIDGNDAPKATAEIEILSARAMTLSPQSPLQWSRLKGTVVYQLQIFKSGNADVEDAVDGAEFVARMISGPERTQVYLSEMVRQQLQPGQQYRWRVTALDENAQLIGASEFAEFTYLP
ncbi:MAG TPA: hypothetical protein VM553_18465 [Dongiaceae bacterium]|nr:hypothetical protein [Dongiaceae bacterium]